MLKPLIESLSQPPIATHKDFTDSSHSFLNQLHPIFFLLLLGLLMVTGCVRLGQKKPVRLPEALPDSFASKFAVSVTNDFKAEEKQIEVKHHYTLKRMVLDFEGSALTSSNITIDYYELKGQKTKAPAIILLPISGGGYEVENHFARYFAKRGLAVALVHRRAVKDKTPTVSALEEWFKLNTLAHKRVLDWMQTRDELDSTRIGVFGISIGGIQAALLTPIDSRVKAAVFGLAAGDLPFVVSHSTEKKIAMQRGQYVRENQMTLEQFQRQLQQAITYDPNLLAPYVDPQNVLMVLAVCDTVVPFRKGWELRTKLGKPETVLLPTGHYTALLCLPYVKYRCLHFFRRKLEM
jgi:hypothetical protein